MLFSCWSLRKCQGCSCSSSRKTCSSCWQVIFGCGCSSLHIKIYKIWFSLLLFLLSFIPRWVALLHCLWTDSYLSLNHYQDQLVHCKRTHSILNLAFTLPWTLNKGEKRKLPANVYDHFDIHNQILSTDLMCIDLHVQYDLNYVCNSSWVCIDSSSSYQASWFFVFRCAYKRSTFGWPIGSWRLMAAHPVVSRKMYLCADEDFHCYLALLLLHGSMPRLFWCRHQLCPHWRQHGLYRCVSVGRHSWV